MSWHEARWSMRVCDHTHACSVYFRLDKDAAMVDSYLLRFIIYSNRLNRNAHLCGLYDGNKYVHSE